MDENGEENHPDLYREKIGVLWPLISRVSGSRNLKPTLGYRFVIFWNLKPTGWNLKLILFPRSNEFFFLISFSVKQMKMNAKILNKLVLHQRKYKRLVLLTLQIK